MFYGIGALGIYGSGIALTGNAFWHNVVVIMLLAIGFTVHIVGTISERIRRG